MLRQNKRLKRAQDAVFVNGFELACHNAFIVLFEPLLTCAQKTVHRLTSNCPKQLTQMPAEDPVNRARRNTAPGLQVWNVHLGKATWCCRVHGCGDLIEVQSYTGPLRRAQHHKSYTSACKVLLVTHILIGGQKYVETGSLRRRKQIAVSRLIPSPVFGFCDGVTRQGTRDAARRYVIKENEHRPFGRPGNA